MLSRLGHLLALALVAGCTSTGTSEPVQNKYANCDKPAWTWCLAEANR